jgi:hypothetical protein
MIAHCDALPYIANRISPRRIDALKHLSEANPCV